jgi:hypothetical protein
MSETMPDGEFLDWIGDMLTDDELLPMWKRMGDEEFFKHLDYLDIEERNVLRARFKGILPLTGLSDSDRLTRKFVENGRIPEILEETLGAADSLEIGNHPEPEYKVELYCRPNSSDAGLGTLLGEVSTVEAAVQLRNEHMRDHRSKNSDYIFRDSVGGTFDPFWAG